MIALRIAAVLAVLAALVGVALVVARPASGPLGASLFIGGAVVFVAAWWAVLVGVML